MACPVLAWFRFTIAAVALLGTQMMLSGQSARPAAIHCTADASAAVPASQRKTLKEFQHSVESGPLYQELVSKSGKPEACKATWKNNRMTLSYLFHEHGSFQATIQPAIEFSEQKVKLPPITEERALVLLKAAERDSFGQDGCGIKWSEPSNETTSSGSRQVVYRGDTCNCQAREVYQGDQIRELIVRGAC